MAKRNLFLRFFHKKEKNTPKLEESTAKENTNLMQKLQGLTIGNWKSKFISDVYKERTLFPHEEMLIAKKAYLYNAFIHAASNTLNDLLVGGEIQITSKDKSTEKYLNEEIKLNGLMMIWHEKLFRDLVNSGNHYVKRIKKGTAIVAYKYIPDPERMYHDVDLIGNIKDYVYELPEQQLKGVEYKTIQYYGDRRRTVKGIPIKLNDVFYVKHGEGTISSYGRGPVSSVVNDVEIMVEIERAMAIIARYKAIPKKIIELTKANSVKDVDTLSNQLNNLTDDENPIVSVPLNLHDMSYAGKEINFEPIVGYLKKKMTIAMAPSFLMHGDETSYAVSKEQKTVLLLRVKSIRENISLQLKKELRFMAKTQNKVIAEFEIEFGTLDIGQDEEIRNAVVKLWDSGVLTLNEARENLNYPPDKDIGDQYSFDLKTGATEQPTEFDGDLQEEIKTAFKDLPEKTKSNEELQDKEIDLALKKKEIKLMEKRTKLIDDLEADLNA